MVNELECNSAIHIIDAVHNGLGNGHNLKLVLHFNLQGLNIPA